MPTTHDESGIFEALTDFGVRRYATPRLVRILYILGFIVALLYGLVFLIAGLTSGEAAFVVLALIGAPLLTLLFLLYVRIGAELISVLFHMAGNIEQMASTGTGGSPAAPRNPGAPPPTDGSKG